MTMMFSDVSSLALDFGPSLNPIAPDKAVYCVFTQLLGPKNVIKLFSVRTKKQLKFLILNSELFHRV